MTSIKIALGGSVVGRPARQPRSNRLLRLRAYLGAAGLDRRLARGEALCGCPLLRERAAILVAGHHRRPIAAGLERALAEASPGARARGVPVDRVAVREARPELETLAARLLDASEVSAQGMARVRLLLTDGFGPLYGGGEAGSLTDAVIEVRRTIDRV